MLKFCVTDFDLDMILDCGQAFRWERLADGSWVGVVSKRVVRLYQNGNELTIDGGEESDREFWNQYFDLARDYGQIKKTLIKKAPELSDAIEFGWGIRLLNQDPFEMLITFILSANNHIPRIKDLVKKIAMTYGCQIEHPWENEVGVAYSFPSPSQLSLATVEALRGLGLGYRDQYVYQSTNRVNQQETAFSQMLLKPYKEAKRELQTYSGVGPKVADCILLFSSGAHEAFPTDTWIKRTMARRYGVSEKDSKQLTEIIDRYGTLKGFAQQYLFYFERENEKKDRKGV